MDCWARYSSSPSPRQTRCFWATSAAKVTESLFHHCQGWTGMRGSRRGPGPGREVAAKRVDGLLAQLVAHEGLVVDAGAGRERGAERCAASQTSRTGLAVSGAYERYSWMPKPSRPLLATKQGWPSVIPVSMSWKPRLGELGRAGLRLGEFVAVPERVEVISSR